MSEHLESLGYASDGAVHQNGLLKISLCRFCHGQIIWASSKRTGKRYPVNVRHGRLDQRFYMKHDFHRCGRRETS